MATLGVIIFLLAFSALVIWMMVKGALLVLSAIAAVWHFLTASWFRIIVLVMIAGLILATLSSGGM